MRRIFTFCLLVFYLGVNAQKSTSDDMLVILDGMPYEKSLTELDSTIIESISILKPGPDWLGCRPARTVMIIISKVLSRTLFIKDAIDKHGLPGATVTIKTNTSAEQGFADDKGNLLINNRDKSGLITVSMVGYKDKIVPMENSPVQTIYLDRDEKLCQEVVVVGYGWIRCKRTISCGYSIYKTRLEVDSVSNFQTAFNVFPNPVRTGQTVKVTLKDNSPDQRQIKILNIAGQELFKTPIQTNSKDFQVQIPGRWAPGVYILQLIDKKGKKVKTEKIIIQ